MRETKTEWADCDWNPNAGVGRNVRDLAEVEAAELELYEKVWYDRHQDLVAEAAETGMCPECAGLGEGEKAARRMEEKYGLEALEPCCDFCSGVRAGKLSALRWVLGDEWDMLDT